MDGPLRFERTNPCAECKSCGGTICEPVRKPLREYGGLRFTSDGFDCAMPVSLDTHSVCSYGCLYCFSDNLPQHRASHEEINVGQTSLKVVEKLFSGQGGRDLDHYRRALKYHARNKEGYPCPIQCGAICDPMDNIERNQGWLLEFIKLAIKYEQPVRFSTKGKLALVDEYLDAFSKKPELFWVAFSTISPDDKLLSMVDKRAPKPSERIESMRRLCDAGVNCSLRFRPLIPGLSDATPDHPKAYADLIDMAREAGARAISYEVAFLGGMPTKDIKERYRKLGEIIKVPIHAIYKKFGMAACIRPSYQWTEPIMMAIYKAAKKAKFTVGVSDPVWKELTDFGCCCGIPPDDPVFGNWQRENATNGLRMARDKEIDLIGPEHIIPPWAKNVLQSKLCNLGPGPTNIFGKRHNTWADKLLSSWNELDSERGPLNYFQGALKPVKVVKGNIYYRFEGLPRRKNPTAPFWTIN